MGEETQTQFKTEGQPAFPVENKENDNSSASSTGEKTNSDQTQSQQGEQATADNKDGAADKKEDNLADHPRWKERETDWTKRFNDQETRHLEAVNKIREEFEQKYGQKGNSQETKTDSATPELPAWFGGDESQWKQFLEWNQGLVEKGVQSFRQATETQQKEEQKKIDDATTFFNEEVKAIETDKALNPQGQEVDRSKLLKFALDNELVDTKGRWNYRAAFKMMGADKVFRAKEALNERKQIANATTSENRAETKQPGYVTSEDFSKPGAKPW